MRANFDAFAHDRGVGFNVGVHESDGTHWLRFSLDVGGVHGLSFNVFRDTPAEVREVLLEMRNAITTEIDRLAIRLE